MQEELLEEEKGVDKKQEDNESEKKEEAEETKLKENNWSCVNKSAIKKERSW